VYKRQHKHILGRTHPRPPKNLTSSADGSYPSPCGERQVMVLMTRKVKWRSVELIPNAALCKPGAKAKDCPKWAMGKHNYMF
jgi:hypothetical protein